MSETVRTMVVKMSMDAGGFRKTASDIKTQIRNVDKELRGLGSSTDGRMQLLNEKLTLQKGAVQNFQRGVDTARQNLDKAETAADKLLAAKRLSTLETDLNNAKEAARLLEEQIRHAKWDNLSELGRKAQSVGRKMSLYITAPLAALGGKSYSYFKQQESSMVSMQKTIDETDATKYEDIAAAFKQMSESEVPASYAELMEYAGSFGAKGVPTDDIVDFTRAMVDMGEAADDLSPETAGRALAEILNITERGDFGKVREASSAVVDLGNNTNATEGAILAFAKRMATDGALVGLPTQDILGLSAAFVSVGIEAEAGGTASGKVMKRMQTAAELGGNAMKEFAENSMTAGMSIREIQLAADDGKWMTELAAGMGKTKKEAKAMVDATVLLEQFSGVMQQNPLEFISSWEQGPADQVLTFFQSLDRINQSGGEEGVLATLSNMGMTEVRLARLIQAAALNPELFEQSLERSRAAYEENIALSEEAEKRYGTLESQDSMRMNRTENALADYGENIATMLEPVKTAFDGLLTQFGKLDEDTQTWIVGLGTGLAVTGPALVGVGKLVEGLGSGAKFIGDLVTGSTKLGDSALFKYAAVGTTLWILWKLMEGAATTLLDNPLAENNLVWVEEEIASAEELTPALQKAADELERYHLALQAVSDPALQTTDYEAARKLLEPIFTQDIRDELFGGLELESLVGPGSNVAFYLNEYKQYIEGQMAELLEQNQADGDAAGTAVTEGMTSAIDTGKGNVEGALAAMESGLVEQARAMAKAISDAFNENVHFKVPGVDGPGSTTNVNVNATPGAADVYNIKRALTASALRDARGHGKI